MGSGAILSGDQVWGCEEWASQGVGQLSPVNPLLSAYPFPCPHRAGAGYLVPGGMGGETVVGF